MSILRWSVLYERSTKVPRTGGGVEDLTLNGKAQKPTPKRKWEEGNEREKERRRERGVAKKAIKPVGVQEIGIIEKKKKRRRGDPRKEKVLRNLRRS